MVFSHFMNNTSFYESLSPEELELFAIKTFGKDLPSDMEEFLKITNPSDTVLEVGCGTGRLGIEFINKGYDYTGIESQPYYLDVFVSRISGRSHTNNLSLIAGSFENFDFSKKYSVVLFGWTVIGDFDRYDQSKVISKASSLLTSDGKIILDNPSKNQVYNKKELYYPTPFYYSDWVQELSSNFKHKQILYTTQTGVERELVLLKKK